MKKIIIIIGIIAGFSVQAAQTAKVVVDNANVYEKPNKDSAILGTVSKDKSISVSNVATSGFYKSRIPSGVIGWISGSDLLVGGASTGVQATASAEKRKKGSDSVSDHKRILVSAGLNILSNGGFPLQIPITGSGSGYGGTVEMQFKINEQFYWGGRAEYFLSSSSQVISSNVSQTMSFHTLPVMAGLMYVPISKPKFRLGVGVYGGFAMMTSLTVTQTSILSGAATVTYTSTDICEYGNLQGSYAVTPKISILGEAGYQMHSASYPASTVLNAPAFKADFGGIISRLGIEFRM